MRLDRWGMTRPQTISENTVYGEAEVQAVAAAQARGKRRP